MPAKAKCPYCKGYHYSKRAYNRCKKQKGNWRWDKDGNRVQGGK